jgi:acyl transferase domain-containing protein/enoyl-CoA hydratase/carnithine racemase/2-polyprenyl-3-methyl-5-hydroxy-6-metoxy-1,4-benzoquinol methylase
MKRELAHIYRDLSAGTLSQREALERIKTLKQPPQTERTQAIDTLLASPVWERSKSVASKDEATRYAHHVVLLCSLPQIQAAELESGVSRSRCSAVATPQSATIAQVYADVALAYFEAIRRLLKEKPQGRCLVQLVAAERDEAHLFAGLNGLIETASLENPQIAGQVVFVDPGIATADLAQRLGVERHNTEDRVVRYTRDSVRLARRWRFIDETSSTSRHGGCAFKEHGVYLITGGLGGLGFLVAAEILARTAGAKIVLSGRAAATGAKLRSLESLSRTGRVEYRQADVADAGQVEQLLASVTEDHGQLNGIVHSAGILRDDFILKKPSAAFREVLQPKVAGTEHLDRASQTMALDFFLLFSSIASWAGNVGQADYAAANGFLDQFAGYRNALAAAGKRSGRTVAIAWPHWLDGGMNIDPTSMAQLEKRTGLRSMSTVSGMSALHRSLTLGRSHVMVMHGDAADMRRALEAKSATKVVASSVGKTASAAERSSVAPAAVSASASDLTAKTREFLRHEFAGVLKIPVHRIEARAALENYGIDSILAMKLTSQLEGSFGALAKTLFFEYQTIDELAEYFVRAHADKLDRLFNAARDSGQEQPPEAAAPGSPRSEGHSVRRGGRQRFLPEPAGNSPQPPAANEPIAIVGLSGRYPKSWDLAEFWRNLRDGTDCIVEVPKERWDWRQYYSQDRTKEGAHFSKWGGFIEGVDEFDPRFFNIAPREARTIDPQERLFLQHVWMAIEDAGYTRASLQMPSDSGLAGQVGVYAGVMYGEYNLSGSLASIANRVSYFLNLHGPSLTLDTMCSSSLTAIHLACQDLKLGRTSLAIAGGVNVSIHPNKYAMLSGGQFISSDGHCQSFGEGGDGYIPGEGVGVAILKRLSEAQRDGNHIYGVIRGSALNHGGKTNGYTVPNPQAQAEVIRRALTHAGIDARHVSYIEAHGTGTKLGDPIEIAALTKAFHDATDAPESGSCLIGSAKSNIGHCESAAGIAGVTKVLLQMKHGAIVPSLHSRKLNPHIDFGATPFVVVQDLQPWQQPVVDGLPRPRVAGVSSFGAGGSNAHVIIEEYPTPEVAVDAISGQILVPLSARTAEQLEQRGQDLLVFLESNEKANDLRAIAWTLQVGREAMEERAAFIAKSCDDLAAKLKTFLSGKDAGDAYRAQVKQHKEAIASFTADPGFQGTIDRWAENGELAKVAELWVKGLDVDWRRFANPDDPQRLVSLPAYPFARERYWREPPSVAAATAPATKVLHPLVHANTSNLLQQSYTATFSGSEPFLEEGATPEQKVLPSLLALEMARAAAALALPQAPETGLWELQRMAWGEPLVIPGETRVGIALLPHGNGAVDIEIHSGSDAEDHVHCQIHAVFSNLPARGRIDLARLKAEMRVQPDESDAALFSVYTLPGQMLAQLRLPSRTVEESASLPLQPELLVRLAQIIDRVIGRAAVPVSMERARIAFPVPDNAVVWLRQTGSGAVDIDVCDEQGRVCVQMTGLRCESVVRDAEYTSLELNSPSSSEPVCASSNALTASVEPPKPAAPREIVFTAVSTHTHANTLQFAPAAAKPNRVRLLPGADVPPARAAARIAVRLAPVSSASGPVADSSATAAIQRVRLFDLGEGVFSIELAASLHDSLEALLQALSCVRGEASLKVLIVTGRHPDAWCGDRMACNAAIEQGLFRVVAAFPCPVVAAVNDSATGAGLLLASACDFLVCDESGQYGFTDAASGLFPSAAEDEFFRERLGDALADDLLYRALGRSGRQLKERGWTCRVVPSTQVDADAKRLAAELAQKSRVALELLKTHLGRHLVPLAGALAAIEPLPSVLRPPEQAVISALPVKLGAEGGDVSLETLIAKLDAAVQRVAHAAEYKAIVVSSAANGFVANTGDAQAAKRLFDVVRGSPVPVIAALGSNAEGLGWLFGLCCDAAVHDHAGRYSGSALWSEAALAREAAALCELRFGRSFGREVSLSEADHTGAGLHARARTLVVAQSAKVMSEALRLAAFWDAWPRASIAAWKQTQSARLQRLIDAMPEFVGAAESTTASAPGITVPTPIALTSKVVSATAHPDGVVVVTMEDRAAKNMFSPALVAGLKEAFAHIDASSSYKAVVLTGYDSYFASGGTVETLLAIQEGQVQFTDEKVFQRPMDCTLPVIAAIQGHGIGGGWSFGMFADLVLLGEESRYLSPYMGYGFTPGAGSTLMFPAMIGYDLARETLLTAQEISGHELKSRGVTMPVLPRRDVLPAAIALASRIARQPRERLVQLKRLWTQALRDACADTYGRELEMHERTFVRNAKTLETIQEKFSGGFAPVQTPASKRVQSAASSSIVSKLKAMLAQELFLKPEEIDEDAQFIDLGLDSITGVTWIRKINAQYGTDIEATKVYSHPTLKELSRLVANEAASEAQAPAAVEIRLAVDAPAHSVSLPVAGGSSSSDRERLDGVIAQLKAMLAKELLLQPEEIEHTAQFIDIGLDSITGVTWVRKINEHYRTDIEATKVYSHPTLEEMGRLVKQEAEKAGTLPKPAVTTPIPSQSPAPVVAHSSIPVARNVLVSWRRQARPGVRIAAQTAVVRGEEPRPDFAEVAARGASRPVAADRPQPIAVIGMAGQFPQARNVDEFWANLAAGRNCIAEVPDARWSRPAHFQEGAPVPGKTNSKWLGALDDYDLFDPLFFSISPTEAECMDPQQRVFLQACWHSIENAGYSAHSLSGSQCGVFVGCGPSDYLQLSREQQLSAQGFTGAATSILAARISYFLNLRGPCLSIDTACSSSLVAIANACDSLNAGNSDLALAGGVYVMAGPAMHIMTSQAGMLSTDGRCFTFDQRANGFVPGEAVGVMMLKRLADAERDQDRILAVIEGWGVNQDGKTNGITAPNEESQTRLLQSVYRRFDIDPAGIQLIEAHGTGTKLGDPIEVAGLKAAFKPFTEKSGYCALGSVKSNIGHCLTAAGAAGLIKVILALKHRELPPTINYERCNEHIQLERSPFYVNDNLKPWIADGHRRRAAISSFGFSGTNAHLVVAEHVASVQGRGELSVLREDGRVMVPLSARNESQLRQKGQDLLAHIRRNPDTDLVALAYTLQVGRDAMGERLGFMVGSLEELRTGLEAYVAGQSDVAGTYHGQVKRNKDELRVIAQDEEVRATIVDKWLAGRKLGKLLGLWSKGLDLDWNLLYGEVKPRRIELPSYPFAKDRFWLVASTPSVPSLPGAERDTLHPMVHENVSLLSRQRYRSRFSGREFFFAEEIGGARVASPLSLLEMARAAIQQATLDFPQPVKIEFTRVSWEKPLCSAGDEELEVVIDLVQDEDHSISFEIHTAELSSEPGMTVNARGVASLVEPIKSARIDIAALREQGFEERFDTAAFYTELKCAGRSYSGAMQSLRAIHFGDDQLLAQIALPDALDSAPRGYVLHPCLLEGAMHACTAFVGNGELSPARVLLPVSMESLTVASDWQYAGDGDMVAWVRYSDGASAASAQWKLDVDILDAQGECCCAIRGLVVGAVSPSAAMAHEPETVMMTPRWDVVSDFSDADGRAISKRILVAGGDDEQKRLLEQHYQGSTIAFIDMLPSDDIAGISTKVRHIEFDKLIWIASAHPAETLTEESIVEDQARGILQVLKIVRALSGLGYDKRGLEWDLITLNSLPVRKSDRVNPTHAGLQGFSGSLADAYPGWRIRLFDVQEISEAALAGMHRLPCKARNACYALRDKEWFCQSLIPVTGLEQGTPPYRSHGVYVVIGGSGGLGEIWTQHLIEHHQANVIWIGRRALDAEIRHKIERLSAFGNAPEYIQADASKLEELQRAYAEIKSRHSTINGVVHSAVGAFDQNLKTVSVDDFKSILSVKIDLSVRIAQVFGREALDFVVFFSSNASFARGAGMSGYAAGCTFKDAFALELAKRWDSTVKVVNWGYWSVGAGDAISDAMKAYFHEMGYRPLGAEEGMAALDQFVASGFAQMSIGKTLAREGTPFAGYDECLTYHDEGFSRAGLVPMLRDLDSMHLASRFQNIKSKAGQEMEDLLCRLLAGILDSTPNVLPAYKRWLNESRKIVAPYSRSQEVGPAETLAHLWRRWDEAMQAWVQDSGKGALCLLVDRCMRALPDILTGKQKATDVIFPGSSLEFIESVYKTDRLSLAYNDSLSDTLIVAVRSRFQEEPDAQLRFLEIGAGTGATTVGIIEKLAPYQNRIAEYCYTDLSKAFLFHAENTYAPRAPYLRTQIFNVEQPIAPQCIAGGRYDFVIAANVIHATKNIRNTLRNAKAVLRNNGMLLLNEISDRSICGHVTFGLLAGWWLNEDDDVRIPGSPGLYPEAWKAVLEEEGFHSIQFPCQEFHFAGQQIVVAFSDGVVRQRQPAVSTQRAAKVEPVERRQISAPAKRLPASVPGTVESAGRNRVNTEEELKDKTRQFCKQMIGKALKIDSHQIDAAESLESYGIDSIIIGLVNQQLHKHFGDVGATLLYEFKTVDALSTHLIETHRAQLERLFGLDQRAPIEKRAPQIQTVTAAVERAHEVKVAKSGEGLRERTLQFCRQLIGKALKISAHQIDPGEPLETYGIDSIIVGLINQQLQKHLGDIGATLLYEFQTVAALSDHLIETQRPKLEQLFELNRSTATTPTHGSSKLAAAASRTGSPRLRRAPAANRVRRHQESGSNREAIAIIGMSGLYPMASNLEEFWDNLKSGRNCITEIPENRWSLDGFYEADEHSAVEQGKSYCKWGGFVDQFAEFDSLFFGIPPREALNMDPQERLFMQASWRALENSGYTRSALKRKFNGRVGVFAGITRAGYNLYRNSAGSDAKFWPRTSFSSVANRLSYFLDIHGPSLPVDTMCSSSLSAIHEACEHIHNGDCDLAFAGGVNLYLHPTSFVDMSSQHMLSKDGLCRSFGAGANGFVPGEGVGVVLLKRLDRAVEDDDHIHGVILATQVNHGGKTNGFTVPNPVAQAELIRAALDKAGISAREVSYIEAHGTGTELGDPIEIAGLQQAFGKDTQDKGYCSIGSAKSNIGHLEAAAGIAGLTKVLLQLRHRQIAPSLHASALNPHIKFDKTAFKVSTTLASWDTPVVDGTTRPRIAGISSFGAGGANAHVIVQEYQPIRAKTTSLTHRPDDAVIVPLSAKTLEQLQQKVSDLVDFIGMSNGNAELEAIACTLQIAREPMEMRTAFVVNSIEQLTKSLSAFLYSEDAIEGVCRGQVQRNNDGVDLFMEDEEMSVAIDQWIVRKKYAKLAELWCKGLDLDWNKLYGDVKPARVELPTYPFAKDEYWLNSATVGGSQTGVKKTDDAGRRPENLAMIEDIIAGIDDASIEAGDGVQLLKNLI